MLKHRHIPLILSLAVLLSASLLLGSCSTIEQVIQPKATATLPPVQQTSKLIIAEGRVVPKESTNLFFTTSGEVNEVLVKEGDQVNEGAPLARLGDREPYEATLATAQLEQLSAQQQLDDLKEKAAISSSQADLTRLAAENALSEAQEQLAAIDTDETQNRIDDARKAVTDVQDELKDAQDAFDKYKDLDPDNANRKDAEDKLKEVQDRYDHLVRERDRLIRDLELARVKVKDTQTSLDQAQREADARKDGPDPDQLALAQARLKNAQAGVTAAQAALDRLDLLAPYAGKIVKVDLVVGERILPSQTVMVLADFSAWYVETTDLTENEVVRISTDQKVKIIPDALPEVTMTGTVESINEGYVERAGDITYTARILIAQPDPLLRWGMTVEVHFEE